MHEGRPVGMAAVGYPGVTRTIGVHVEDLGLPGPHEILFKERPVILQSLPGFGIVAPVDDVPAIP